jgi:hypothetical protein
MPALLRGVIEMRTKLRALADRYPDRVARGMYEEGEIEMTESKRRCPVLTGTLRASGHVDPPVREGRRLSVALIYGGAAAPYAIYVHENLEAHHDDGQAKFLESVLNESAPYMASRIAARVRVDQAGA